MDSIIKPDHRVAIEFAAESVADLIAERQQLHAVLGVILERIEREAPHSSALTFVGVAQFLLNRSGVVHELRDCIAHLQRDFPLPEVCA